MEIRENVPLAPLTTFQIGGAARYFTEAQDVDEIRAALAWARERGMRQHIIAGGSNLLIPDNGLNALVIKIISPHVSSGVNGIIYGTSGGKQIPRTSGIIYDTTGNVIEAAAGCDLLEFIRASAAAGMTGWEKMAGIPGTLGGAIRGNAGAFGTEIKDALTECDALNIETDEVRTFTNVECRFAYRTSFFKQHPEWVILSGRVGLTHGDREVSERMAAETIAEREKRHIQNVRAAGSFFMNPVAPRKVQELFEKEKNAKAREGRVPAGWLIEKAGMKGARVGGAVASEQHPNYLVNETDSTATDVLSLAEKIKKAVLEEFGISLCEEVCVL